MEITYDELWNIYRVAKADVINGNIEEGISGVDLLSELLQTHEIEDEMLNDSAAWLLWRINKAAMESGNTERVAAMLSLHMRLYFEPEVLLMGGGDNGPPVPHSLLLGQALKIRKEWAGFPAYLTWFDLDRLSVRDYIPYVPPDGKALMALAERAYIAMATLLLEGPPGAQGFEPEPAQLELFLGKIYELSQNNPNYTYPLYYVARILIALKREAEVKDIITPFLRQKRQDFWPWAMLAESLEPSDPQAALHCYAKALTNPKVKAEFLVNVREKMAHLLAAQGYDDAARAEIDQAIADRLFHWNQIPARLQQLTESDWYVRAVPGQDNTELYRPWAQAADAFLAGDLTPRPAVVSRVDGPRAWFVAGKDCTGALPPAPPGESWKAGEALMLTMEQRSFPDGATVWHVYTATRHDQLPLEIAEQVQGKIRIREGQNFGFVNDKYYVHGSHIAKQKLRDGQLVVGIAVLGYDKAKDRWGWSMVEVQAAN